jgi:hypothetical protein
MAFTLNNGRPDTMMLFHDADVNASLGLGSDSVYCKDVKLPNDGSYKYNAVFCSIPSNTGGWWFLSLSILLFFTNGGNGRCGFSGNTQSLCTVQCFTNCKQ